MNKFYSIVLINKLGKEHETIVLGTQEQANDYAIKEASSNGCTYDVRLVATYDCNGVKNITNN